VSTVNGKNLLECKLSMGRVGAWHADVVASSGEPLTNPIVLDIDGVKFHGTTVPGYSGAFAERATCRVVGGKGGLSKTLPARNYANGPTLRVVLDDIMRECGESLSETSDTSIVNHFFSNWQRVEGPASKALVSVLDAVGGSWRVLADGKIWIGIDSFPAVTKKYDVLDEDWVSGTIFVAPDAPDLAPAVTFDGHQISYVVHRIGESLRTELHLTQPGNAFERIFKGLRQEIDYSRTYPCKVVTQNDDDGTLQLMPDDGRVGGGKVGATGLDRVPIRLGLPGFSAKVPNGARVTLGFDAGDPKRPYAALWDDKGNAPTEIKFMNGNRAFARVGDQVKVFASTVTPIPVTGTLSGAPFVGTMQLLTPFVGVIQSGRDEFKG
jgi:hypothetical protein